MKVGISLLAAGLVAGIATAATAAPGLSAKGEGRWEIQCKAIADGEAKTVILAPDTSAYAHPKLVRASCDYRASSSGDLTISVTGAAACPFAGAASDACVLIAPKSKRGTFSFKTAPAR